MCKLHPLDEALLESHKDRKSLIRLFSADGVICERERTALDVLDELRRDVLEYRERQQAADAFERNGVTRYTQSLFRPLGLRLVVKNDAPDGPQAA